MLSDRPLFTKVFDQARDFEPVPNSVYLYGLLEQRSSHFDVWAQRRPDVLMVQIQEGDRPSISTSIPGLGQVSMRRLSDIGMLLDALPTGTMYVDITGLSHHVWAPLMKVAVERLQDIKIVYVEPASYSYSANPMAGDIYDLSERIEGIEPIPLFTVLSNPDEHEVTLIASIGFEGARFAHVLEEVDPPGQKIFPVIGIPGFRAEYPFNSYLGNQIPLTQTRAWQNVRFARANCPFSLFYTLQDIAKDNPDDHIKLALIGTKPHSLGGILFTIASDRNIEIVYDHPRRKARRTTGTMQCLLYSVSDFLIGNPAGQSASNA